MALLERNAALEERIEWFNRQVFVPESEGGRRRTGGYFAEGELLGVRDPHAAQ